MSNTVKIEGIIPKCEYCGREVDHLLTCSFCAGEFCIEHRLPEKHDCPNQPGMIPVKKILAVLLLIVILSGVLWNLLPIISLLQDFFFQPSYTRITVLEGKTVTVEFGEEGYNFTYGSLWIRFNNTNFRNFWVETSDSQTKNYFAIENRKYRDLGLEIVVSEVHSDYIILLLRSLH